MLYAHASRLLHLETTPGNARALIQRHGDRDVAQSAADSADHPELDAVFDLPYARVPHPSYGGARIPAYEMIRFLGQYHARGCFGGCTFCSITEHEGRIIQSRSEGSILREIEEIRDRRRVSPASFPTWADPPPICTDWPASQWTSNGIAADCPVSTRTSAPISTPIIRPRSRCIARRAIYRASRKC